MKAFKTFLLAVIVLFSGLALWGQKTNKILCDLHVEIKPYYPIQDSTIYSMYGNICKITQSFQIRDYQKDTLYFAIDKPSQFPFLNMLYFQKMVVMEKNTNQIIPYVFTSDTVKVISPKKNCIIDIHYYYQPDYFMLGNYHSGCIFCPYQQSWFSWYFSAPNMKINNVVVDVPENLYLFSNLEQKKTEKNKIYLSTDSIPESGVAFFWVEKRFYEPIKTNIANNQYNLYFFKDVTFTGDTTSCQAGMLPLQRVDKKMINTRVSELNRAVEGIEKIFSQKINFDIVEACLDISQGNDTVRWGSSFPLSENQVFIFMDTDFWSGHECLHEMVHAYNSILPPKTDSSYYLFHESMTEYLSVYFKYPQTSRDSVYEAKILKYINLKQGYTSIFEINKSELGLDYGGTFGVTYLKTPFVINSFAKKIGENKFIEILSRFYKQIRETKVVNFQEFEKMFKSNGVSDKDWDWFVKKL